MSYISTGFVYLALFVIGLLLVGGWAHCWYDVLRNREQADHFSSNVVLFTTIITISGAIGAVLVEFFGMEQL